MLQFIRKNRAAAGVTTIVALAMLVGGWSRLPAQNAPAVAVEKLVPSRPVLYLTCDGSDLHREAYEKTAAYQALDQSGLRAVFEKLIAYGLSQLPVKQREGVRDALQHAMRKGVTLAGSFPAEAAGPVPPVFTLIVHEGAALAPHVATLMESASGPDLKIQNRTVEGRAVQFVVPPGAQGVEIGWWSEGGHLLITGGLGAIDQAAAVAAGKVKSLADAPEALKAARTNPPGTSLHSVAWLDLEALRTRFSGLELGKSAQTNNSVTLGHLLKIAGVDGLKRITSRSGYAGKATTTEVLVEETDVENSLLSFAGRKPISLDNLPPLPSGTRGFYLTSFDLGVLYERLLARFSLFAKVTEAVPLEKITGTLNDVNQMLGFDLKADLLEPLGHVVCLYDDPANGFFGFGAGLAVSVDNSDRLRGSINKLFDRLVEASRGKLTVNRTQKQGREVLSVTIPDFPLSPALSIDDKWLVVGLTPQAVDAHGFRSRGQIASWKITPEVQQGLEGMPKEFASLSVTDPRQTYGTLLSWAPFILTTIQASQHRGRGEPAFVLPITAADIPPAEVVTASMFPNVTVCSFVGNGLISHSRASVPAIPLLGGGDASVGPSMAVGVALLLPAVQSARTAARRAQSMNNMKQIAIALHNHESAYRNFPTGTVVDSAKEPGDRLSWMVGLLPFVEQLGVHQKIDVKSGWASEKNVAVKTAIPVFLNPNATGMQTDAKGYGVTHYVGIAGVGADAPTLPRGHARAGMFGYDRKVGIRDVTDGTSNTIGVADASKELGSWAAGGTATLRSLTKQPYVNGPDGLGGNFPGGMGVMFIDGSVRFVSDKIDPKVLEALSTISGGEVIPAGAIP